MAKLVEITDQNFEQEVLSSDIPVLIDFWADWCGPCKMIAPAVEEIANEYEGKVKVGKLDVDTNPNVASRFGIRSIPTLLIIQDGKVVEQIIGAVPKKVITDKLDSVLV
jgi:thioredoxin 1